MSVDRPNPEAKPQIGEMPMPHYMSEPVQEDGTELERWIGIDGYAPDGQMKAFLWFSNADFGDLTDEDKRHDAAALIARLKLGMHVDAAVGPAVDLDRSDRDTGHVAGVDMPGVYGVYIEAGKRGLFGMRLSMDGLHKEKWFRRKKPNKFEAAFQAALAVLPVPSVTGVDQSSRNPQS